MNKNGFQQDLFERFLPAAAKTEAAEKVAVLDRHHFSIRLDQLLLGVIFLLGLNVYLYTLGVEEGKHRVETVAFSVSSQETVEATTHSPLPSPEAVIGMPTDSDSAVADAALQISKPERDESLKPDGKYTIQVVTYNTQSAAERLISQLQVKGYEGFVIPSGQYLQVCVNAFQTQGEAKLLLSRLKSEGLAPNDAFIRPMIR